MAKRGGFPGGMPGNMNNLMKQAQRMQRQMEETTKEGIFCFFRRRSSYRNSFRQEGSCFCKAGRGGC